MLDKVHDGFQVWAEDHLPEATEKHLHVVQGTVYDKIIGTARDLGAHTIVIGAHRPEFRDYLVCPNAARVVRHADQTVLVVR